MSARAKSLALGLLCAIEFILVLDGAIATVALPSIKSDLDVSEGTLQYISSLYALTFGGLLLIAGRAGDLFGRRRLLMLGLGVFTLSSLACGLAGSAAVLLAGRAAQGVGAALAAPASLSLLTTTFDQGRERNRALGNWGAMAAGGGAAGQVLGGLIVEALGWEWIFFVNLPIAGIAAALAPRLLPESRNVVESRRLDAAGALLLTLAIGLLVYGVTRAQDEGFTATEPVLLLAGASILLLAFGVTEAVVPRPLIAFDIFRNRTLLGGNVVALSMSAIRASQAFFSSFYMQGVLGYSALQTGLAFVPLTVLGLLGSGVASQLVGRLALGPLIASGSLLTACGLLLLSGVSPEGSYVADVLPGSMLVGFGIGSTYVLQAIAATDRVPGGDQGLASGLLNTGQQIGRAVGLAAVVTLAVGATKRSEAAAPAARAVDGYQVGYQVSAGIAVLTALLAILVMGRKRSQPTDPRDAPTPPSSVHDPKPGPSFEGNSPVL